MAEEEIGGVVDSSLRVFGTANVRVVDASIMPIQPGTHLQATIYAISEKVRNLHFFVLAFTIGLTMHDVHRHRILSNHSSKHRTSILKRDVSVLVGTINGLQILSFTRCRDTVYSRTGFHLFR